MRFLPSSLRRRARQQQHQIGMLGARGPDLLAVDDVVVAVAPREGLERSRVGAAGRLGDAEGLQPQLARGDLGQILLLLRLAAVAQQRAHDVHLRVAGGAVAAGALDLLEDRGGGRQRQAGAAVLLRDQRGEIAGVGQRLDELARIGALAVELAPILAGNAAHKLADLLADFDRRLRLRANRHRRSSASRSSAHRRTDLARLQRRS